MHLSFRNVEWKRVLAIINAVRAAVGEPGLHRMFSSRATPENIRDLMAGTDEQVLIHSIACIEHEQFHVPHGKNVATLDPNDYDGIESSAFDWILTISSSQHCVIGFASASLGGNELCIFWRNGDESIIRMLYSFLQLMSGKEVVRCPRLRVQYGYAEKAGVVTGKTVDVACEPAVQLDVDRQLLEFVGEITGYYIHALYANPASGFVLMDPLR